MSTNNQEAPMTAIDLLRSAALMLRQGAETERAKLAGEIERALDQSLNLVDVDLHDWRIDEGEEVPPEENRTYRLKIEHRPGASQFVVEIEDKAKRNFGLDMVVEINRGLPCLHFGNQIMGDHDVHIFVAEDGLAIVPDSPQNETKYVETSRFYEHVRSRDTILVKAEYTPVAVPDDESDIANGPR